MKTLFFICCLFTILNANSQHYWQQQVSFKIEVALNDTDHSLQAFERIEYINNSPDTLRHIWFHVWPNAYKNDKTAFSEQLLQQNNTSFYFSSAAQKGYINQLSFRVDDIAANFTTDSINIDIIKLLLPRPVAPGARAIITTPFHVQLPSIFSRSGYQGNFYQVTQWFPKPAVLDADGWHPMPYLSQGEFYSEFGDFDVSITAPAGYVVAATGELQNEQLLQQLKSKGTISTNTGTNTWRFKQQQVHDFAWFAGKELVVEYDTVQLPDQKTVSIFSYHKPDAENWNHSLQYVKAGLRRYSQYIGPYPYSVASVVQGAGSFDSYGMEYPTIAAISNNSSPLDLETTIVHEVGHNWFYGALASNERQHPWMDEGMNTYYEKRYLAETHSPGKDSTRAFNKKLPDDEEQLLLQTLIDLHKDQPIETPAENFTDLNYGLVAYYKISRWMQLLSEKLGKETFDNSMRAYYQQWKFRHPQPNDFKESLELTSGKNLDSLFNLLNQTGNLQQQAKKTTRLSFLFNERQAVSTNYLSISPAVGYNTYDKVMLGGMLHNYQLPLPNLQLLGGVLYATGSKKLNGFGHIGYTVFKRRTQLNTTLSYLSFSQNDFSYNSHHLILGVKRWVPGIKIILANKNPLSTQKLSFQFKSFLLTEDKLQFAAAVPPDSIETVSFKPITRYINRLTLQLSDDKTLYPYSLTLNTDQGKDFLRTGLTAKCFFNFADGESGLATRFFAGKFFYLHPARRNAAFNEQYFLNLGGPKGNSDYTYSDYFIGRNEFEGKNNTGHWTSQQLMERDGFFKVNTEQLSYFGKTDNWLMALNLSMSLPRKYNPLGILPIEVPFKLFADAGTYADVFNSNMANGRFVYDAGLQVSLFNSLIDIYLPLFYSKIYRDYYKSTFPEKRFLKTIAFTINISNLKPKYFLPDLPL